MSCSVTRFKVQDWDEIVTRPEARESLESLKKEAIWEEVYTKGMPIFTYREDEGIVMIYGMLYMGCGTFMPVIVAGELMARHAKTVIKLLWQYYATYVPANARRLEAYCDIMDVKAVRLTERFGFTPIGIRHNSSVEGHDQVIMERLVNCDARKVGRNF